VSGPGYRTAHLDELERFDGDAVTIPVRIPLGIGSFGINAYAAREVGGQVIEDHDELGAGAGHHEELYFVLKGHARFVVDGEELDGPQGTFVFVPDPATRRAATAAEADTTVLVVGGTRGEPFAASPWESWLEALPLYTAKDYDGATAIMRRALEEHPDNPNVLYNTGQRRTGNIRKRHRAKIFKEALAELPIRRQDPGGMNPHQHLTRLRFRA